MRIVTELSKDFEKTSYAHCFSGITRIMTKDGIKCLKELVDKEIKVFNVYGEWEDATVKDCGRQELIRLTIRHKEFTKNLCTTKSHDWLIKDGLTNDDCIITTEQLKAGDEIPFNKSKKESINILTLAIYDGYDFAKSSYAKLNKDIISKNPDYLYGWLFGYIASKAYLDKGECFISDSLENIEIGRAHV